jgi:hypothetical protein
VAYTDPTAVQAGAKVFAIGAYLGAASRVGQSGLDKIKLCRIHQRLPSTVLPGRVALLDRTTGVAGVSQDRSHRR